MASSISSPIATASPPNVIVLTDSPKAEKTSTVMNSETGIEVNVMNVVRKFSRKRNKMTTTRMAPSRNASSTFSMERSMNDFCEYSPDSTRTSSGSPASNSTSASLMASDSARVSAFGCLLMVNTTAGPPLNEPSVSFVNALLSPRFT